MTPKSCLKVEAGLQKLGNQGLCSQRHLPDQKNKCTWVASGQTV
jgi:hypothetical protein